MANKIKISNWQALKLHRLPKLNTMVNARCISYTIFAAGLYNVSEVKAITG
ncbi:MULTISPECIES: hypothetical protein [unclassified Legionella]|uniref:hypothetical protein n=1 Tax=unclassified Legionella TaxID=2622702 RepID=UPI001E63F9C5|nr:hypothetical protein [Legionella sp. 31fI33]MCC5016379.1 hypothetical protein [Legionella sp. 31fI33]